MEITIDGKTFTMVSKELFKMNEYMFKVKGPLGDFSVYGSVSDCNTLKLYALATMRGGDIVKRKDSYVYGHNISYKLAIFINENIDKIPDGKSELKAGIYMLTNADPENLSPLQRKYVDVFMNPNIAKHHPIYEVLNQYVETTKVSPQVQAQQAIVNDPSLVVLFQTISSIFSHVDNNYERLSHICSFYLNLFTVNTDLVSIECLPIGKNEMTYTHFSNSIGESCDIHITPYEFCIYRVNFSNPTREHADYVCSQYGIDPSALPDSVLSGLGLRLGTKNVYPSVNVITQSYTYVVNNKVTGEIFANKDRIEIPYMVIEDGSTSVSELGTYENFILCGGYITKLFDYSQQLINPTEYKDVKYGFIIPYVSKMWNPLGRN